METEANFSSFTNYKQTVIELTSDLKKLREYSEKMGLHGNVSGIDEVLKRLMEDNFSVAIIGEFKRGKSTLINALLGKDILPMDVMPATATLNKINYGLTPSVTVEYKDGRSEQIAIEQLKDYVTKLTGESQARALTIKEATVYYPVPYCKNGVTIIDTPGLNDNERMTEVTLSVLPTVDAALMVVMAQSPFSESEKDFIENKIINSDLGRLLFVVTGIDIIDDEADVERVLESIKTRIQEHVMKKAENTYGIDSPEYEVYKRKIGTVRVYGVSAKNALKGKIRGDEAMLQASRFPAFEAVLEKFLTEDRGAVMLNAPVSRIKTSSIELVKAVTLRQNALAMQENEFESKSSAAMQEIKKIREERKVEMSRINEASLTTFTKLKPEIDAYWPTLIKIAMDKINSYPLTGDDISEENSYQTQQKLAKAVQIELSRAGQNMSEKIQHQIEQALESESDRLSGFEEKFFKATDKIASMFVSNMPDSDADFGVSIVASSLLGYGLGGIYLGYKEAGWKGALLGGASSVAGTLATGFGVGLLMSVLSLPATWPVLLVGSLVAAFGGSLAGKFVVGKALVNAKIDKFRDSFKDSVRKELQKLRDQDHLSDNVEKQINDAFDALKKKLEKETENILQDTESQLAQLKVELAQKALMTEKEKEELTHMVDSVREISLRAEAINKQLSVILAR